MSEKLGPGHTPCLEDQKDLNGVSSDHEKDAFEDATATKEGSIGVPPLLKDRSLTERSSTSNKTSAEKQGSRPQSFLQERATVERHAEKANEKPTSSSSVVTVHRSSTEAFDATDSEKNLKPPVKDSPIIKPTLPSRATKTLQGLSGALPSLPWTLPPQAPSTHTHAAPPLTRKLTSPFTWLSRNTTPTKEPALLPSPSPNRRDTTSTLASLGSNPEMMLSKLEESSESDSNQGTARNSLKDRFKLLRMREEAGIQVEDDEEQNGLRSSVDENGGSRRSSPPNSPLSQDLAQAPGTASVIIACPSGPHKPAAPVDWDLWQSVVYEGPAAVARTSAEELKNAIAAGIPNVIRGVVWQVLAQSKNEELEGVYRDLISRGNDKSKDRSSGSSAAQSFSNGLSNGKETIKSSASSIHSDQSTPATTLTNGIQSSSPPTDKDTEAMTKAQAAAVAAKKQNAKEDAAALSKLEKAIKRDLGARTSYSKYAASAGLQDGLFGVCKAYALFDDVVGYAQGMNFLAMPLLFNMPGEEAFCLLVRLMNKYGLRDLFIHDMPGLHMHLHQFSRLLEDFEPALYCHLHRRHVSPNLYATQWFLTLFAYRFPLQLVLRIYDLIFSEGLEAILKIGIVLMQKNANALLAMTDMVALTTFLKDRLFDVYIDQSPSAGSILESGFFGSSGASIDKEVYRADHLIQDACSLKITPEILKAYTRDWEEKARSEKEREDDLESLKSQTFSLTSKVRVLEERVEKHDTEHAALATELVRTKVENEELRDDNEALRVQVRELREVVEKQPGEVEARLASEMDRIIRRNEEVHGANTRLEEEMISMEKNLVGTKMMYAELNANHETLQRRWADLRKALN